jgi:hypothetical protein
MSIACLADDMAGRIVVGADLMQLFPENTNRILLTLQRCAVEAVDAEELRGVLLFACHSQSLSVCLLGGPSPTCN